MDLNKAVVRAHRDQPQSEATAQTQVGSAATRAQPEGEPMRMSTRVARIRAVGHGWICPSLREMRVDPVLEQDGFSGTTGRRAGKSAWPS